MKKLLKVAITGGIGSGKSTFADFLFAKGYPVIKADILAKKLYVTHEVLKQKLIAEFGNEVYPEGNFDRIALYQTAFINDEKVKRLNEIVHPVVIEEIKNIISYYEDEEIIFIEAALIYEAKMENLFDYVVLITADEKERIERTRQREKISGEEVKRRMKYQTPDEVKKEKADFTFYNNGTVAELEQKANLLLQLLLTRNETS
ncbi:MAG: dephospho-CoA kinase [Ignavibacteria bacterium CG22_combo_CG10-13_8_21_14_all_37_15]|nr:dephospho-CoA kinase [Ignavibacteria bacterium]OIO17884.1 MAG: dephospho-CoA kinase [Ignavibacteria bacterium CG1_02_37_35]PIP78573.1 MAG: dephospho-CoA kinase [Ignavibacteria bacterium CG22_combo_CG10-13_8_21_14_all_37_15]PIS43678.1 MAG: dephospho-CoA kinase [Ignavibacteria bacterium CG08_land_8_20_14_0_20_37_9]PIX92799.1 MAG: dephospho-CoA kinase [Ignavibacteria bacterium CG_4_10_14_3_um_filter_37_18]PJC60685.1 MAG: dephospho-CoA kinase [Ignavibacteria bacterium CG_4_9_14_0_2_um_filter_37